MTLQGQDSKFYQQGYYAGYTKATKDHLGCKCVNCEETNPYQLEIHHKNGLDRKSRQIEDLKDLNELELECKSCHSKTGNWRGKINHV